uniref:hAT-like transposase RNase-H fold domain-containing protein n=1 Tax=Amphimedon queenslandica TaxID=400682 RepID=A0A1X7V443_AMPQE
MGIEDSTVTSLSQINQAEEEIEECDRLKRENLAAFTGWKCISCFIHTLQLVVKLFETNPSFQLSLEKAKSLVKAFNKSCNVTEKLTDRAGKKLVNDCRTRWDSTFVMIARLLEVKNHVS